MGVAVMMSVIVGMNVSHGRMLYYNITGVHALALSQVGLLAAPIARALLRLHPQGGRRENRVRAAPAVSRAIWTQENAHEHTGSAEAIRPSLRGGFTAYFVLFPVTGLSCHRHFADHLRKA
jgi:hypothetical protein